MFLLNDSPGVFSCLSEITDYKNVNGSKALRMFFE